MMIINTSNIATIKPFLKKLTLPQPNSHKGQNGKVLIIGGSSLFHAASLWSAAIASRIVDIVHYSSTKENQKIFINLKSKFIDGIIIKKKDLQDYIIEDDVILVGPGMTRGQINQKSKIKNQKLSQIVKIKNEVVYTYSLTKFLIDNFSYKKFVFDAGALQIMEKEWLLKLKEKPILTPHQIEFETLFGINIKNLNQDQKKILVKKMAKKFNCLILLKAINDIISDGEKIFEIQGGNPGLTKGGTGDVLAGLITGLNAKNDQLISMIISSFLLKKAAEELAIKVGFWYNATDLVHQIPKTMKKIFYNNN